MSRMSGMDMLMKQIMQAAGIDPEKVTADIQEYGRQLADKIASMDASLKELRLQQTLMYELLLNISLKDRKAGEAAIATSANGGMPHAR